MKTHEKKYHNATFYRKIGISITILIRELGTGFEWDIKHRLINVERSENLYEEEKVIEAVKKFCKDETIDSLYKAKVALEKNKQKRKIKMQVEGARRFRQRKKSGNNAERKEILKTSKIVK